MEAKIHALLEALFAVLSGLAPGAIGAGVAMAWKKGLTWRERFIRLAVGSTVCWFSTRAIGAIWPGWSDYVVQAIGFTLGMIAFEATPKFIAGAAEAMGGLPAILRDRFIGKGDGK